MCTHTLVGLKPMKKHFQRQSVAVNLVPSGRFGVAAREKLHWDIFFLFQKLRLGWER